MKKQLVIIGILAILVCVGLSGCNQVTNFFDNKLSANNKPSYEQMIITPKNITLNYIINASPEHIHFIVYDGLYEYLSSLPREISYTTIPPTTKDFIMRDLDQEEQKDFLLPLVTKIENITQDKDIQAKIAISIVQNIPYDMSGYSTGLISGKYPYEVLYTQTGVCGEKSELLLFLLRALGFDTVSFEYSNHRAVGVKCPIQYSYDGTGYCFIESTVPSIITDSNGDYLGVGKLTSYSIITISTGKTLNNISEEFNDALEFNRLNEIGDESGGILNESDYNRWWELVNKYGIKIN